jgi:probable F420-dependent oxidoreductase
MKFGIFLPAANPFCTGEYLTAVGRGCEERGVDSVWTPEHVVLFEDYDSDYPYAEDGRIPGFPGSGMLDPFGVLTWLAACTTEVRLGTAICLVPQRNPVYTSSEVATLDWLSGGRFDFGIGVGWLREEYEALGVPFERRGKRADEYLRLLKALWTEEVTTFEGEFHSVRDVRQDPKPVQSPHPPILVGGESDAAMARVAALGDGWFGWNHLPDSATEHIARLGTHLDAADRSLDDVRVTVSPYFNDIDEAAVEAYASAGVDELVVFLPAFSAEDVPGALDSLGPLADRAHQTAR